MNCWAQLAKFSPEEIEQFFERVFEKYGQAFKPLSVNEKDRTIEIELKDGRKVKEKI